VNCQRSDNIQQIMPSSTDYRVCEIGVKEKIRSRGRDRLVLRNFVQRIGGFMIGAICLMSQDHLESRAGNDWGVGGGDWRFKLV
jgi:hypothetical protein